VHTLYPTFNSIQSTVVEIIRTRIHKLKVELQQRFPSQYMIYPNDQHTNLTLYTIKDIKFMLKKRQTLINCMNSRQWLLMSSFLGPVGLAISSITPPASSKTLTISCYDTDPSKTTTPKNESFLPRYANKRKFVVQYYYLPSPHFEAVATKCSGSVNP